MRTLHTLALATCLLLGTAATPPPTTGLKAGDKATDFKLKNVDGSTVSLATHAGSRGAIVIFTCNHCPFSQAYEDRIMALHAQYAPLGLPVIAINPNDPKVQPEDSYENMQKRAKEKGFSFPYVFDDSQQVARSYGATRTPHVFLLRKEGKDYQVAYVGAIDDNSDDEKAVKAHYVAQAAQAVLAGQQPATTFTKSVGCGIKWRKG